MRNFLVNPIKKKQYVLLFVDSILIELAFFLAYTIQTSELSIANLLPTYHIFLCFPIYIVLFYIFELYRVTIKQSAPEWFLYSLLAVLVANGGLAILFFFVFPQTQINRITLLLQIPFMVVGLVVWRVIFFNYLIHSQNPRRILFIGEGDSYKLLAQELETSHVKEYKIAGIVTDEETDIDSFDQDISKIPIRRQEDKSKIYNELTTSAIAGKLEQFVKELNIDLIVFSLNYCQSEDIFKQLIELQFHNGVTVYDMPNFYANLTGKVPASSINSSWILNYLNNSYYSNFSKVGRFLDIVGSVIGLTLLCPLFLVIAIAIKLDSRGPVFFKQERLGWNKKPFTIIKFRSMIPEKQKTAKWATEEKDRITRVGNFLRKSRLDEFPELINVLSGKMSIIGFRPIRKEFADKLASKIPFYSLRFTIKPGLTGWPQVKYGYAGSEEGQFEKFQYELFYLKNASFFLDGYIFVKTFQTLLWRRGE